MNTHLFRYMFGLLIIFTFIQAQGLAQEALEDFETHFAKVSAEISHLENQLDQDPDDFKTTVDLAHLFLKTGGLDRAYALFNSVPEDDKNYDSALAGATKILIRKHNFQTAIDLLERKEKNPLHSNLKARAYFLINDYSSAEEIYSDVLKSHPNNANALVGLALCEHTKGNRDMFTKLIEQVVNGHADNSWAFVELANYYLNDRREDKALETYVKALIINPFDDAARAYYGFSLYRKKDTAGATEQFKIAIRINPFNYRARRNLGNGLVNYDYPENSPKDLTQLCNQAAQSIEKKEFDRAIEICNKALSIDENWGMAHFLFSEALQGKLRQQDFLSVASRQTILKSESIVPKDIDSFVPNFNDLSDDQKKLVCLSAAPLRKHIPALIEKGGTFYILPLKMKLTESPGTPLKPGARTFDGRLWDDIKGMGGLNAVTGIAALEVSLDGDFNMFAHEFAHQVHIYALSDEEKAKIKSLYEKAMETDRTLDYYAASNEYEYFAQGYEAYVSTFKRPNLTLTSKHTRQELLAKDPELFIFIANLVQ